MSEQAGAINVYRCPSCGWCAITKNRDEGTTPFLISCEGRECDKGQFPACQSSFYRVDQALKPTHEWYRPTTEAERAEVKGTAMRQHVAMGGLLLRKLGARELTDREFGHIRPSRLSGADYEGD